MGCESDDIGSSLLPAEHHKYRIYSCIKFNSNVQCLYVHVSAEALRATYNNEIAPTSTLKRGFVNYKGFSGQSLTCLIFYHPYVLLGL